MTPADLEAIERCSFFDRDRLNVRWLIAAPAGRAHICDVCILLAVHALADRLAEERNP